MSAVRKEIVLTSLSVSFYFSGEVQNVIIINISLNPGTIFIIFVWQKLSTNRQLMVFVFPLIVVVNYMLTLKLIVRLSPLCSFQANPATAKTYVAMTNKRKTAILGMRPRQRSLGRICGTRHFPMMPT